MAYASALESAAARSAIGKGDLPALERYLREGGGNPVQSITGATATLIAGTNVIRKDGTTTILPLANGTQDVVRVVIYTAQTSSNTCIIKVGRSADTMIGFMTFGTATFAAGSTEAVGGTDDTITLTAAAGGVQGTVIVCTDVAPNLWLIDGRLASTTAASVLSATV